MNPEPSRSLENLLAQSDWVTALARGLVADRASADDVTQGAWLDALRAPPTALRDPRAWLTTVVRRQVQRLRRGAQRRQRHEHTAAREAAAATAPAPDELSHRLQTHRELVDAVLALGDGDVTIDCTPQRWLQLVGSAYPTTRTVHFVFDDERVVAARCADAPALLGTDGDIAPLLLPPNAIAVELEHGSPNTRRLLTDDVAVHLRVR